MGQVLSIMVQLVKAALIFVQVAQTPLARTALPVSPMQVSVGELAHATTVTTATVELVPNATVCVTDALGVGTPIAKLVNRMSSEWTELQPPAYPAVALATTPTPGFATV